jgi:putative DNA primase/helicase
MNAASVAAALRGDVVGRDAIIAPGPGHSPKDRSLSVKLTADGPVVFSHAGDDWRACKDHVNKVLGITGVHQWTGGPVGLRDTPVRSGGEISPVPSDQALRIWRETVPIAGTLAEKYLLGRSLDVSHLATPDALRFHPSCPFGSKRLPCMVALYRDIRTNEAKAIHRTALKPDGTKLDRKVLGPKAGCAIKITPDEDVSMGLTIGEGIETVLGGMALNFCPAWALGDAGEIAKFPVLSGIECLTILVDNDASGTGQASSLECSRRWTAERREVFRVVPIAEGSDMADVVRGRAA